MATGDITTDALVIRVVPSGDNDKLLTLLCMREGRILAVAHGARSFHSKLMAVTRPFVWGNFELRAKGGSFWIRDASVNRSFDALNADIELMYLAQYISDVCCEVSGPGEEPGELLPLVLNTFFALSGNNYDRRLIKAAFEMRVAAISGYLPELYRCDRCDCGDAMAWYLDVMSGGIVCNKCVAADPQPTEAEGETYVADSYGRRKILLPISAGVLQALRYVTTAESKRVFSFALKSEEDREDFCNICETFLLNHLERGFSSLKLYRELSAAQYKSTK